MPNHDPTHDENQLRQAVTDYQHDIDTAIQRRDTRIRAHAGRLRQVDIIRITGYSRETVRQILMTAEQREALRARRRKTPPDATGQ